MDVGRGPHGVDPVKVEPGPKARIPKGLFNTPYAKRKDLHLTTDSWWIGLSRERLNAEAWKRHPGTDNAGVQLKIWSTE